MTKLTVRGFGRKRSTGLGSTRGAARARTRRERSSCNGGGKNGSAQQNCTGDGGLAWDWRATALALAETGAHVLVHYGRSVQEAQSLVESIHSKGGRADAMRADLGTAEGATLLANCVGSA
jgi:shikimate 5-dehydrogenase